MALDDGCLLQALDPLELAWAAGFFDGEGSTMAHRRRRNGYLTLDVSVPQASRAGIPVPLLRFQRAVLGLGRIDPPRSNGTYVWRSRGFGEAQATIALLWPHIGEVKRTQAAHAMQAVREQYDSRRLARRALRRRGIPHQTHWTSSTPSRGRPQARTCVGGRVPGRGRMLRPRALARAKARSCLVPRSGIRVTARRGEQTTRGLAPTPAHSGSRQNRAAR